MNLDEHIEQNKNIRFGKPVIKNTQITVQEILDKLSGGKSIDEVIEDHPGLSRDDIFACLVYASDKEKFGTE